MLTELIAGGRRHVLGVPVIHACSGADCMLRPGLQGNRARCSCATCGMPLAWVSTTIASDRSVTANDNGLHRGSFCVTMQLLHGGSETISLVQACLLRRAMYSTICSCAMRLQICIGPLQNESAVGIFMYLYELTDLEIS